MKIGEPIFGDFNKIKDRLTTLITRLIKMEFCLSYVYRKKHPLKMSKDRMLRVQFPRKEVHSFFVINFPSHDASENTLPVSLGKLIILSTSNQDVGA